MRVAVTGVTGFGVEDGRITPSRVLNRHCDKWIMVTLLGDFAALLFKFVTPRVDGHALLVELCVETIVSTDQFLAGLGVMRDQLLSGCGQLLAFHDDRLRLPGNVFVLLGLPGHALLGQVNQPLVAHVGWNGAIWLMNR